MTAMTDLLMSHTQKKAAQQKALSVVEVVQRQYGEPGEFAMEIGMDLKSVAEYSGYNIDTLRKIYKRKKRCFETVVRGAIAIKETGRNV